MAKKARQTIPFNWLVAVAAGAVLLVAAMLALKMANSSEVRNINSCVSNCIFNNH